MNQGVSGIQGNRGSTHFTSRIQGFTGTGGYWGIAGWTGVGMESIMQACIKLRETVRKSPELQKIIKEAEIRDGELECSDFIDVLLDLVPDDLHPTFLGIHNEIDKGIANWIRGGRPE